MEMERPFQEQYIKEFLQKTRNFYLYSFKTL
jgi:hypothetical protein